MVDHEEKTYETVEEWLGEVENYSLRAERIPKEALPWVHTAWNLGKIAGMTQVLDALKPRVERVLESNKKLDEILNRAVHKTE